MRNKLSRCRASSLATQNEFWASKGTPMGIARIGDRIRYEPTRMGTAEVEFRRRYPQFDPDGALGKLGDRDTPAWTRGNRSTSTTRAAAYMAPARFAATKNFCANRSWAIRTRTRRRHSPRRHWWSTPAEQFDSSLTLRPTTICASSPLMRVRHCGWWGSRTPSREHVRLECGQP